MGLIMRLLDNQLNIIYKSRVEFERENSRLQNGLNRTNFCDDVPNSAA